MYGTNDRKKAALTASTVVLAIIGVAMLFWGPASAGWTSTRVRIAGLFSPPAASAAAPAATGAGEKKILYYQDPMHPWYKSDKPGNAPDCGMKLVAVYADEGPAASTTALPPGTVQISPARQQLVGVTTARAEYRLLERTIRTVGRVDLDEERVANVHVKVNGWIQKVFVDYTWQYVKKGDALFTIYSPDLLASEQEYLLALRAQRDLSESPFRDVAAGGNSLLEAARRRLSLWDLTDEQIRQLEETGKPQREITFYAPASGHVLERKVFPNQYVTPDTELYKLADHSEVWIYADVYESEAPFVGLGQEATLTSESLPGETLKGRVSFIQPHLMEDTRTLPVRMEFPNPDLKLKPGMFVNVELRRALGRQLTVPVDAVLDSGRRQVVFVAREGGSFEPREVKLGERAEDYVSVLRGLRAGELIVMRANFLIDSESNLREAMAGMAGMPQEAPAAAPPKAPAQAAPPAPASHEHRH